MDGRRYLLDVLRRFRAIREECEGALAQVPSARWDERLDPGSNSIRTLLQHLSGNLRSRWTGFLATDGEKPDRDRDSEFEDAPGATPEALLAAWGLGWACLFEALEGLKQEDLERTVTIRSRPLTVLEAIQRQLSHYAYHSGQVVFLCKHLAGSSWRSLSIPRGGSAAFNAALAEPELPVPAGTRKESAGPP
jgi:uncharacterized damage-inducible protein DinB